MTWLERMAEYLEGWRDTPYSDSNVCRRGKGVNCLRFACDVLDWLHGYNPAALEPIPVLPPQTAIHRPELALEVVRFICRRYPCDVIFRTRDDPATLDLQPSDVVVNHRVEGHPEHILVAGPRKNVLWHSYNHPGQDGGGGVDQTGIGWCINTGIYRIWRPRAVASWS